MNVLKVDDYGITTMEKFPVTTTYITLKITKHGAAQFMYWIQHFKEIYLDCPSGNPDHVQVYILAVNHFMQDQ